MTQMSNLNTVDIVLLVLFVIGGIQGAFKGFLEELAQKFGFVFGFVVALMFSKNLSSFVLDKVSVPVWMGCGISYVILFLAGYLFIKIISKIISDIIDSDAANFVDSLLGFVLGLFEMLIVCGALIQLLGHQSLIDLDTYFNGSLINTKFVSPVFKSILSLAHEVF